MKPGRRTRIQWIDALVAAISLALVSPILATDQAPHEKVDAAEEREAAPAAGQSRISGCIDKNNQGEFLTFDLQIGTQRSHYLVKGTTNPKQGIFRTDSDYSGVQVVKQTDENGLSRLTPYRNQGLIKIYLRQRRMEGVTLAGVPVAGNYVQKLITNSLVLDGLVVDGKAANGKLAYNIFTSRYSCKPGQCRFGEYAIESTEKGNRTILNGFNLVNQGRMRVTMKFGDFNLNGAIRFTDTTQTTSAGDGGTISSVTASRGCFNVVLTKPDGSNPVFADYDQAETEDGRTARALIAWLQIQTHDLFTR